MHSANLSLTAFVGDQAGWARPLEEERMREGLGQLSSQIPGTQGHPFIKEDLLFFVRFLSFSGMYFQGRKLAV